MTPISVIFLDSELNTRIQSGQVSPIVEGLFRAFLNRYSEDSLNALLMVKKIMGGNKNSVAFLIEELWACFQEDPVL